MRSRAPPYPAADQPINCSGKQAGRVIKEGGLGVFPSSVCWAEIGVVVVVVVVVVIVLFFITIVIVMKIVMCIWISWK